MTMTPPECTTCTPLLHAFADRLDVTEGTVAEIRQAVHDVTTRRDAPQIAQAVLPDLALDDQVTCLMHAERPEQWCTPAAIRCLAQAWPDARQRLLLATAARKCGVMPAMLAGLVEQWQGEGTGERLATIDAYDLLTTDYARRQDVIADVLPAGCTLLAGNAKDGKSLLAYHLAACVATGTPFLGQFPVQQGEVLFFALEDGERRGQERLARQGEQLGLPPEAFRGKIAFRFWDAPKLGLGFEAFLTQWLDEHPQTRLIVIDILEKIRPPRSEFSDLYRTGYATTAPLTRVAQEKNVALLVVHHTNKNPHADPRLLVSGPMSVLGGADNAWLLRRAYGETEAELIIAGRDIPEQEWALRFEEGLWSLEGTLSDCRMSRERREVLEVLQEERAGMKPYQLAQALGKKPQSMRSLLKKMRDDGHVALQEEGTYVALVAPPAWRDPATTHCQHASVAGVHGVVPDPACMPDGEACTPLDDEGGNAMHAGDGDDAMHARDGDDAMHAGDAIDGGHAGNAIRAGDAIDGGHAGDAGHAGNGDEGIHAGDGDEAGDGSSAMHAPPDEEDPFLEPEAYPESAKSFVMGPSSFANDQGPGTMDPASEEPAQTSTPAHASRDPDDRLQEDDWFWPLLPGGARHSVSPWQVIEMERLPNGQVLVHGQTPTGKLNRWPLPQCRKALPPEDTR